MRRVIELSLRRCRRQFLACEKPTLIDTLKLKAWNTVVCEFIITDSQRIVHVLCFVFGKQRKCVLFWLQSPGELSQRVRSFKETQKKSSNVDSSHSNCDNEESEIAVEVTTKTPVWMHNLCRKSFTDDWRRRTFTNYRTNVADWHLVITSPYSKAHFCWQPI